VLLLLYLVGNNRPHLHTQLRVMRSNDRVRLDTSSQKPAVTKVLIGVLYCRGMAGGGEPAPPPLLESDTVIYGFRKYVGFINLCSMSPLYFMLCYVMLCAQ